VQLRVATYNIHKCRGMDGRVRPERVAAVLRGLDADVIALQEVVRVSDHEPQHDQAEFLRAALRGYELAFGETRSYRSGTYGNAVLSRFPIVKSQNYDLTWRNRERRGCLRADLRLPGDRLLHLFNVHLGTAFLERRHQGRRLLSANILKGRLHGSRLVLGDFNEWVRGLVTRLLSADFNAIDVRSVARHGRTYPGVLPFLHLDHIYFDQQLELKEFRLHRGRPALVASDHLPLVADFRLRD
jgi:endonuclease/exonuclease/phosphatase family metal-dependent hydrolase